MKNVEIPKWLESLPLAPEFHPTDTEFADPIAYISKIENEASAFGICKIIPPLPKPSRKYVLHNLNKSLSKCPELGSDVNLLVLPKREGGTSENCDRVVNRGENRAVFTTRHQELGCEKCKRGKGANGDMVFGAQKQVWQSGEVYTLEQFEAKSKNFAKSQLGVVRDVNPLVIESMFWKAASEKPIYVEYANDVPGSGFGEPEGLLSYFHRCRRRRRRRKRNSFDRNNLGDAGSKNDQVNILDSSKENNASVAQNNPTFCKETASNNVPSGHFHQDSSSFGRRESQGFGDNEGTAGWKLSNSPWNLQVIARSPGSLTRFMPDDIPGVTSPMVYIGMLFSWFAWHVEDHELHSLNFLHIGSAKTWYAVPGDYAFNFEEAIRRHAYGENADRMVALSLLGEKTTVLSPEVILSSGIPCCRLVQNPGEFVVTFPRAYHIGFSHGFNCGEAANFGTPKWLTIAKEAAVRRAAMNYLPMLSHQQLLYLLTMSFISRIPRSLLPGVRSSRLRDRQREERELSVKKAFIADIIHENGLLTVLLKRNSYQAILWDVESLPSSSKESEICKDADVTALASEDICLTENDNNVDDLSDLSKYISAVGFDLNDDDLAYDFQIESGTLPCVACGILGFPFMAVIQPSEVASIELTLEDPNGVSVESGFGSDVNHVAERSTEAAMDKAKSHKALYYENGTSSETSQQIELPMSQCPSSDCSSSLMHEAFSPKLVNSGGWNVSNAFLRPRIFCLEHAIEIEKLLSSKGGANVLGICHSDFQKIKTHAAVIAEETAIPYRCTDIPLGNASLEDLNVVDIAIERDEQVGCAEDWTSKLCINLQHCVRVKKSFPSKNVQHMLGLEALCCDAAPPVSNTSSVEWQSRKARSKRHLKHSKSKSSGNHIIKEGGRIHKHLSAKKDVKIIQYSRKKFKAPTSAENNFVVRDIMDANQEILYNEDKGGSENVTVGIEISELELKQNNLLSSMGCTENAEYHCELSAIASRTDIENEETQPTICTTVEVITNDKGSGGSYCHSQVHDAKATDASTQNTGDTIFETVGSTSDENRMDNAVENEFSSEDDKLNESSVPPKSCSRLTKNDCGLLVISGGDDVSKETSRLDDSSNHQDDDSFPGWSKQIAGAFNQAALDSELSNSPNSNQKQQVPAEIDNQDKAESACTAVINESTSALTEEHFLGDMPTAMDHNDDSKSGFLPDKEVLNNSNSTTEPSKPCAKTGSRRKREVVQSEDDLHFSAFVRSPCEGLRSRAKENATRSVADNRRPIKEQRKSKKLKKSADHSVPCKLKEEHQKGRYGCELDGCTMSFQTKAELLLHKANRCPVKGCRKKFNSHKYAIQHQRVHDDDRPLKCPWNGCSMSFKWAWARTEHLRVHTGERPYACKVEGCGLTFRFVSDFSRHRRKTGHYVSQPE